MNMRYIYYEIENEKFFNLLRIMCCYFINDDDDEMWCLLNKVQSINDFCHHLYDSDDIDFILRRVVKSLIEDLEYIGFEDDDIECVEVCCVVFFAILHKHEISF